MPSIRTRCIVSCRHGPAENGGAEPAIQVLNGLGIDPNRVRQRVIKLLAEHWGEGEAGVRPVPAGRGKRNLKSEVHGRLEAIEWRLSILEHRVGTGPNVRDLDRGIAQVRRDREAAADPPGTAPLGVRVNALTRRRVTIEATHGL